MLEILFWLCVISFASLLSVYISSIIYKLMGGVK